ncbi:DNA glycosylase [Phyllosticta citrichinensis]|uniref:DNA glycosylase n=1 Tax=Phyllosticta citrichinensis TaxID=1130410 RepID=A0ABR1Y5A3_9PEZI
MSTLTRRSARIQSRATSEPAFKEVDGKARSTTDIAKDTKSRAKKAKSTEPNGELAAAAATNDAPKTPKKRGRPPKKKAESSPVQDETESAMPPPQTPISKRRKVEVESHSSPAAPRPAEPHASNVPLTTPGGSRVTYLRKVPAQGDGEGSATLTTETLLKEAEAHLIKIDPGLKTLIEKNPCKMFSPEGLQEEVEPFKALISSIMAQQTQVSGAAARSIKARFVALFAPLGAPSKFFPTPAMVSTATVPHLRTAGLSTRKAEYSIGVAQKFVSGELSAAKLASATDDELLDMLIQVRGLGRWSVEMFSVFTLKRTDVFSVGDLGVQRGMAAWQKRDVESLKRKAGQMAKDGKSKSKGGLDGKKWKYMTEQEMLDLSEPFKPYR